MGTLNGGDTGDAGNTKRKRGVHASRTKLNQALNKAGLKTQTALAQRIAKLEGLTSEPRGLVNKIFREEPVDPVSIERVANALGVPAWSLYLNADDAAHASGQGDDATVAPDIPAKPARPMLLVAIIAIILLGIGWWVSVGDKAPTTQPNAAAAPATNIPTSLPVVAVTIFDGERGTEFATALEAGLATDWDLLPGSAQLRSGATDPDALLDSGTIDIVLSGSSRRVGRYLAIDVFAHRKSQMQHLWSGSLPLLATAGRVTRQMQHAARAATASLVRGIEPDTPTISVQEKYLNGRLSLDAGAGELNIRRALTLFESAIREKPDYVAAIAGLCEALVLDSVRTGNKTLLEDAAVQCGRAVTIDPESFEALRATAYLARKRGQLHESKEQFEALLARDGESVDSMLGLTEVLLALFVRGEDPEAQQRAVSLADRAIAAEPSFWRGPFTLARAHYYGGDLDLAIIAGEKAATIAPNAYVLNNLGTFAFCGGDHQLALDSYSAALAADPSVQVSNQNIGVVHYFLRDFESAAALFRKGIQGNPGDRPSADHRAWGNLGDALRHAERIDEAIVVYDKAAILAEQAVTLGDAKTLHDAYRAYYYVMLTQIDPARSNKAIEASLDARLTLLSAQSIDPIVDTMLAAARLVRGERMLAEPIFARLTEHCVGLGYSPDLDELRLASKEK